MALIDDDWVHCQLALPADHDEWITQKTAGPGRDARLLPDHRVTKGKEQVRQIRLTDAVRLFRRKELPGWPFTSPPAGPEYCLALDAAGLDLILHGLSWEKASGLSKQSGTARLHKFMLEALHQFISYDQLHVANSAGFEYLFRALIGAETAVRRNPACPDYAGLDALLVAPIDRAGSAITTEFNKFVASLQRDDAQVFKQQRLFKEEQDALHKSSSASASTEGGGAIPKAKAKAKGRGRVQPAADA